MKKKPSCKTRTINGEKGHERKQHMLKHVGYYIGRDDIPRMTTLSIPLAECQRDCQDCHSPWLKTSEGVDLAESLPGLIEKYKPFIQCICFLGEGDDTKALLDALRLCKQAKLQTALYSGAEYLEDIPVYQLLQPNAKRELDYLKVGQFKQDYGDLDCISTNQRMFEHTAVGWVNITRDFRVERR